MTVKEAYRAFTNKTLPDEVLDLLAAQEQKVISAESSEFEFLLRALQLFLDAQVVQTPSSASASLASPPRNTLPPAVRWNNTVPPLGGSIPDMVCTRTHKIPYQSHIPYEHRTYPIKHTEYSSHSLPFTILQVSTTTFFVGLQQVYQTKAHTDRQVFKSILSNIMSEATRTSVPHAAMKMTRTR